MRVDKYNHNAQRTNHFSYPPTVPKMRSHRSNLPEKKYMPIKPMRRKFFHAIHSIPFC